MPVKIRLQRHGKKGKPFYWIVAADSRAKRDGKFLEKLGTYNSNTDPAQITLNVEHSVTWLRNGAQPTETARRILSYKGVMIKHHLLKGVDKGALTEAQAEEKFQAWMAEKDQKIEGKKEHLAKTKADARAKALEAEREVSEKRRGAIEVAEENEGAVEEQAVVVEEAETAAEAEETKEAVAEKAAEPAAEKALEAKEEVAAKAADEEPAKENKAEEASTEDKAKEA